MIYIFIPYEAKNMHKNRLNNGLTIIIDEYNNTKLSNKDRKRQIKLRRQGEEFIRKHYLMKHELENK